MPRIDGVTRGGSLLARIGFYLCRRKVGRVIRPLRIHALHGAILAGYGHMERGQEKAHRVPSAVKSLAGILTALRVGCPF